MGQHRDTKLTLGDLIAAKAAKAERVNRSEEVYIDSLGGTTTMQAPAREVVYKAIDMQGDTADNVYSNTYVVYNSIPLFRDPELLAAYEVKDNLEIVARLLEPYEINELAGRAMMLGGYAKPEEAAKGVKN
ncbi:hypothetical protein I8J29_24510 [Paenibacillus sp. MWE-103]|uniref:Phage portal protein n=1 Tax=Paenibacillus artemisiicola TaxID=1172618 RepID=A0ABS3WGD0_9BACL|nr:hypothetical protein [Paenibacillus artemisiicola]MBO7747352.1 hypothetical protein [Paenibacillus artemisiicola]